MATRVQGQIAEAKALSYLLAQGLKLLQQNYTCRLGEIDLIMRDREVLVFVEVRARASLHFGGGMGSITYAKRQKILKAATHFLMTYPQQSRLAMRFDVISIDGKAASISWIKDAFGTDY